MQTTRPIVGFAGGVIVGALGTFVLGFIVLLVAVALSGDDLTSHQLEQVKAAAASGAAQGASSRAGIALKPAS